MSVNVSQVIFCVSCEAGYNIFFPNGYLIDKEPFTEHKNPFLMKLQWCPCRNWETYKYRFLSRHPIRFDLCVPMSEPP